ncbi:MAG: hypothetical protein AB7O26_15045 [Planctomycetaceae bacterium]
MPLLAESKLYVCPGETHPISRAVHLGRLAAFYPACRDCPYRAEVGQIPAQIVELTDNGAKPIERKSLFTDEGVRGVHRNELTRARSGAIATALAGMLWDDSLSCEGTEGDRSTRAQRPSIVVGYDERPSSPDIVTGVTAALRRMGCQVLDIALTTKPCLWFTVDHLQASAGVIVTGAGYEPSWTGLDFVGRGAIPFSRGGELDRLEARQQASVGRQTRHAGPHRSFQAFIPYEASLWKHFHALRPLKIAFGCSSRLVRRSVERTFANLPCRLIPVAVPERSRDLNDPRDPDIVRMAEGVRSAGTDLGVLIGDDGQTSAFFDEHGRFLPAVQISRLVLRVVLAAQPGGTIAVESAALPELGPIVESAGGLCVEGGSRREEMSRTIAEKRAALGCGSSGRLWFGETFPACDAILTMARVLEALSQSDAPFSDVLLKI